MPTALPWLGTFDPYETFGAVVGTVMLVIAAAQWLASRFADRRALRLFALRYLLAAVGWYAAHPQAHIEGPQIPWIPMIVAVGLQALTIHALDVYLEQHSRRRLAGLVVATLLALGVLALGRRLEPTSALPMFGVLIAAMVWCAVQAGLAARREHNEGHAWVAAAFTSYPLMVLAAVGFGGAPANASDLSYLLALPAVIVGITVLVVSLIRAVRRTQDALAAREAARAALQQLNQDLEARVADRTRELRTMVEGLESFNRHVSHDLRGPLAGLAGLARMATQALRQGQSERARSQLALLADHAERTQAMAIDLLTLSRVGDAELRPEPQAMGPLVEQAIEQIRLAPGGEQLLARVALVIDPLPVVPADAVLVRQVWANLLGNALRFAASRSDAPPRVHVGSAVRGGTLGFFVADNGPGFGAERAGELFVPFCRLHGAELSHNGIGLSIVRRTVERHGGRAWAESTPGQGATFWFTLGPAA